jgi:hypothetical protein
VLVAQIPGRHPAGDHRAVVGPGRLHRPRVLLGVEGLVLGRQPVPPGGVEGVALQVDQLLDRLPLTGVAGPEGGGEPVGLAVVPGDVVEAVEPGLGQLAAAGPVVVVAQPADEVEDHRGAPHPGREPLEAAQRRLGRRVLAAAADIAVHPVGVRPVGLDGHGAEPQLLDEPPGHAGPGGVELVGAVGGLADQHEAGVPDQVEQDDVVVGHAVGIGDRHDPARPLLAEGLDGGAHAGPGGQAVVDQDHGPCGELRRWPAVPVGLLAPGQLAALPLGHLLDGLRPDPEAADDILVEDQGPAADDRPHGHLLVAGDPELADQEHAQGRRARSRPRRPPAPRPGAARGRRRRGGPVPLQEPGQDPAGPSPVAEQRTISHPHSRSSPEHLGYLHPGAATIGGRPGAPWRDNSWGWA